jgi:hypothetical protein
MWSQDDWIDEKDESAFVKEVKRILAETTSQ